MSGEHLAGSQGKLSNPTLKAADVVLIAGQRFGRAPRRKAGTPLEPKSGFDGWFKPDAHGVLLLRPDGTPFVYASRNGGGFLVSAHLWKGRVRYLFSTTAPDEEELDVKSLSASHDMAKSILKQAGVQPRYEH